MLILPDSRGRRSVARRRGRSDRKHVASAAIEFQLNRLEEPIVNDPVGQHDSQRIKIAPTNGAASIITSVELPETFYVFVNESVPVVAHNIRFTRRISSAAAGAWSDPDFVGKYLADGVDWLPFLPNPAMTPWLSFFGANLIASYGIEYAAELTRRRAFPDLPSRLSAVYAFGDRENAAEATRRYGWPLGSVREFRLVPLPLTRIARCNMEIVSLARYASAVSSLDEQTQEAIWTSYWSGAGDIALDLPGMPLGERQVRHSGELWEFLIDGAIELA